jgi:phage FluMu gp28-like protein
LKQQTLIEQHADQNKMHIYFIVEREIPNKASDKTNTEMLNRINANEIPALEVKNNGKGLMFVADSPHADGSNYLLIGTLTPKLFDAQAVEDRIRGYL